MQLSPFEEDIIVLMQGTEGTPHFEVTIAAQADGYSLQQILSVLSDLDSKGLVRLPVDLSDRWALTPLGRKWKKADAKGDDHSVDRLAELISEYNILGLELNTQEELERLKNAPDFIQYCAEFLDEKLAQLPFFSQKALDKNKRFTFHVNASFDKKYYCAAKLADSAIDIQANQDSTTYYITFDGTQIEEIDLMYYNLFRDMGFDKAIEASEYLKENLFFAYLQDAINFCIGSLREQHGYSRIPTNSVLVSIIKGINKKRRKKLDELYAEMIKENRANVKWSSEYKLFDLIGKYVGEALYQYRSVWLGSQSYDIFLPSQSIAIEYQGEQHYQAVELFGGQEALERNIERDNKKRRISSARGITVLDWKYDAPINTDNVLSFLNENGIELSPTAIVDETKNDSNLLVDMAPIFALESRKTIVKTVAFVIKQYSADGTFIADYDMYKEASLAAAVSTTSIRAVIEGRAKTAGGYQWKRLLSGDPENNDLPIKPIEAAKVENTAKAICQIAPDGKIVAEYESIKKASKVSGVNNKSIREVLNGTQKTAGGFHWVYKPKSPLEHHPLRHVIRK